LTVKPENHSDCIDRGGNMSDARPGRGSDQFALRLPDGMRDRIRRAADQNGRSMNAEIVATLEAAYPDVTEPVWDQVYPLMDSVILATDETDRAKRLAAANASLKAIPGHGGYEIKLAIDPDDHAPVAYLSGWRRGVS
jgi:hypothetical protein